MSIICNKSNRSIQSNPLIHYAASAELIYPFPTGKNMKCTVKKGIVKIATSHMIHRPVKEKNVWGTLPDSTKNLIFLAFMNQYKNKRLKPNTNSHGVEIPRTSITTLDPSKQG